MKQIVAKSSIAVALVASALSIAFLPACKRNNTTEEKNPVVIQNHSATPALIKTMSGFSGIEVYSLISSEDKLAESPDFVFGGSADGSGIVKKADGTGYYLLTNHEDNWAVSRLTLDNTFKPVKGEYVMNSDGGIWRLCSATMATPQVHGFGPYFLTVGEGFERGGMTHKIDPLENNPSKSTSKTLPGLGQWSGENSVPLHKDAYTGKTVILTGEDATDATGGQLALYLSNTVGDLDNGSQYMLRRKDLNQTEKDIAVGTTYDVEFVKIENHKNLTFEQTQALVDPLKAIKFGRVEDIDYRKGSGANSREIYFNVCGLAATGTNADASRTIKGRVYKLVLDANSPLTGKLECLLDGDNANGPAAQFQNPDNICVTTNYAYIQEDPNTYGNETHDAYIYQYNLSTKELKVVFEVDHRRNDQNFHPNAATTNIKGNWEFGAMVDVSDELGIPNTFYLAIQPHTWRLEKFTNPDGGTKRNTENQGSQLVVIKGLPR